MCLCLPFVACSDDDDAGGSIPDGFYGVYCNNYQNRVYRYYSFYEDGTGEYTFEGNVSTGVGYYTYTFKGNKVELNGYKTDAGMTEVTDLTMTFEYRDGNLISGEDVYEKISD